MLNEEVKKYRELSGDTNPNTSISRIGGYLDGYEKALEQTRWIPIGERLPEGFEPVLFTSKNGEIAIGFRDPRFKTYWACIDRADWHHTDFDVIAWMPLPESYQEGEKNEHN